MVEPTHSTALRALCLGVGGGFRAWPPLGALALTYEQAPAGRGWRRWPVLRNKWARAVLVGVAAYELVADKLPDTQSRLALTVQPSHVDTGLLGRVGTVALGGAALGSEQRAAGAMAVGAAFAGLGALIGNFGGYFVRKAVVEATGLPDPVVALVGDAATLLLVTVAVHDR